MNRQETIDEIVKIREDGRNSPSDEELLKQLLPEREAFIMISRFVYRKKLREIASQCFKLSDGSERYIIINNQKTLKVTWKKGDKGVSMARVRQIIDKTLYRLMTEKKFSGIVFSHYKLRRAIFINAESNDPKFN